MNGSLGLVGSLFGCALLAPLQGCAAEEPQEAQRATTSKLVGDDANTGAGEQAEAACSDLRSVTRSYELGLLREPDQQGFYFYVGAIQSGYGRLGVLENLATSPEALQSRSAQRDKDFITQNYLMFLHRQPGPGEAESWVAALDSGASTRSQAILGFIDSAEFADAKLNPDHACYFR
jgi:hypothetical protein